MSAKSSRRQRCRNANRARETPHGRPSSSSSASDSDCSNSADEEARIGSMTPADGRLWTMRSVSKGAGGRNNDYSSTRQDDYSDDGYGSSEDKKPKRSSSKKGGYSASDASYDSDPAQNPSKRGKASANNGDDDDQQEDDGSGDSKKWWWIGGLAAILVVILIIGGLYLWNRSDSASSDDSASSSAMNNTSLAPSSATDSSTSNLDQTPTSEFQSTTVTSVTESVTTSSAPSKTKNADAQKPSATPSKTQPDPAPWTTYAAQITWFNAPKEVSECGTKASNNDYVVRISPELYGDPESVSPLCGTWISLYQLEKDSMVRATIEGISANMTGHNLDLSRKVFEALTSNLKLGTTLAQWWLTEEKYRPSGTLSSAAERKQAAPTGKGDPKGEGGNDEEGTVTIATAANPPPLETGGLSEKDISPNGISVMSDY